MARHKLNNKKQVKRTVEIVEAEIKQVEDKLQEAIINKDNYKVSIEAEIEFHELKLKDDGFMPIKPEYKFETNPRYVELKRILLEEQLKSTKATLLGRLQGAEYEVTVLELSKEELEKELNMLKDLQVEVKA